MIVHLVDGTYEHFRHFYGLRRFREKGDAPRGLGALLLDESSPFVAGRVICGQTLRSAFPSTTCGKRTGSRSKTETPEIRNAEMGKQLIAFATKSPLGAVGDAVAERASIGRGGARDRAWDAD
jgi:hypothetical protein